MILSGNGIFVLEADVLRWINQIESDVRACEISAHIDEDSLVLGDREDRWELLH